MGNIDNNELIFIGSHYPTELKSELMHLRAFIDFPADVLQQSILKGLDENECRYKTLTSVRIRGVPLRKKLFFKPFLFSHNNDCIKTDYYVGAVNFPIISRISEVFRLKKGLKRLTTKQEKKDIIIYAIGTASLIAVVLNRKRIRSTTLIVPDLPEFMSANRNLFYKIGKKIDRHLVDLLIRKIDKFVLLSPHMREKLPMEGKPWIHMEGMISGKDEIFVPKEKEKVILYTGNMSRRYGINDLLEAFQMIESQDYRLWFRGKGDCLPIAQEKAKTDKRICCFERMEREELLRLQHRATVLINPVRPSQPFTKYYFPSKTMEYLASGTPTIMYRLGCLPNEYYDHLFFVEEESVECLRDTIVNVCSRPASELIDFGQRASEFVLKNKNPQVQMRRVIDFIEGNTE